MFENSDRVYMSTKSIHVHVQYVCVHTLYMIVLTLQSALQCICCMSCGESWSVYLWCWGPRAELLACGTENCCGSPIALPEV